MNILLVAQNYSPFVGGVETHARQIAQELSREHSVAVAVGNFLPNRLPRRLSMLHHNLLTPGYASYQDGDVPIHSLTPSPMDRVRMLPIALRALPIVQRYAYHGLNRLGYPWYRWVYQKRLEHLMVGVDIVHSLAGGYLGWAAQDAARKRCLPFVCTPFCHPKQWGDGPEDIEYYLRSDAVIGLVPTDTAYLESLGVPGKRLHTIGVSPDLPPTSDPDGFRRRHNLTGHPVVLYVGRMMPQKGAQAVLAAAPLVWQHAPDTRFVFIGPLDATAEGWFADADPRILCLGKVNAQEKADALHACDVFCMPSLSEILPTVYLEAWSYGKPVVGGLAPGLPELIQGHQAGLAVSQEPPEVASALLDLLENKPLRDCLGQCGQVLVAEKYSVPAVTGALEALYVKLVG